jgi:hypothetical protein
LKKLKIYGVVANPSRIDRKGERRKLKIENLA